MACLFCQSSYHLSQNCDIYYDDESRQEFLVENKICFNCLKEPTLNTEFCSCNGWFSVYRKKCYICFSTNHNAMFCDKRENFNVFIPKIDQNLHCRFFLTLDITEKYALAFSSQAHLNLIKPKGVTVLPFGFIGNKLSSTMTEVTKYSDHDLLVNKWLNVNSKLSLNLTTIMSARIFSIKSEDICMDKIQHFPVNNFFLLLSSFTSKLRCWNVKFDGNIQLSEILAKIPNIEEMILRNTNIEIDNSWPKNLKQFNKKNSFKKLFLGRHDYDVEELAKFLKMELDDEFFRKLHMACNFVTNKDPYILIIDGQPGNIVVTAINLKTSKPFAQFPLEGNQKITEHLRSVDGDVMGVLLSLCNVTSPEYPNHHQLFKAIKGIFAEKSIPVFNCINKRLAWTMCLVGANISAKIGDKILIIMTTLDSFSLTYFQFTKDGYKLLEDGLFNKPEDIDELRHMAFHLYADAKNIILTSLSIDDDYPEALKKALKSSKTVIIDRQKCILKSAVAMYNWFKDKSDLKYATLPICVYKHQLGFKFNGKDYPLITVEQETPLPFTQTVELPRTSFVFYTAYYDHHTKKMENINLISIKNAAHRREISFTLNEQHLPEYSAKPIILDPIKSLPDSLKANGHKEVPVIAFFDNSTVICVWNDEKEEYEFLDTWNGMYGYELLVGFNTEKPCYGCEAAAVMRTKPTFVVSDLLNIIAKSKKKPFYPYGFEVTTDDDHPVLLEFDTYDGNRKAASPGFLLAMLMKEQKRLIKEKSGFKPSKIGFCLPMMKGKCHKKGRKILSNAIKGAFKLVSVESFVIDL